MSGPLWLVLAIIAEVGATSALNMRPGWERPGFLAMTIAGYIAAFYCLSLALRTLPLGAAYAVWSGGGIAALAVIGWICFRQPLTLPQIAGLVLILVGILMMRLPAKT